MVRHTSTVVAVPLQAHTQLSPVGVAWSTTALIACSVRIRSQDSSLSQVSGRASSLPKKRARTGRHMKWPRDLTKDLRRFRSPSHLAHVCVCLTVLKQKKAKGSYGENIRRGGYKKAAKAARSKNFEGRLPHRCPLTWAGTTSMAETASTCDFSHGVCDEFTPATHQCDDCKESLCLQCFTLHGVARSTKHHRIPKPIPGIQMSGPMVRNAN